ncbi:MAG: aminopeptidase P family N-terminal domain-containing protein, partial [Alicyclobacillus sp.]|nr:aminopeptidase P family N-terminal domain-containing protein [Alicyclobacillus sp.]
MKRGSTGPGTRITDLVRTVREAGYDGVVLTSQGMVSWLTGARSHVNLASTDAVLKVLVLNGEVHVIASNIEVSRLCAEELDSIPSGSLFVHAYNWFEPDAAERILAELGSGRRIASEADVLPEVKPLRFTLDEDGVAIARRTGRRLVEAVEAVACEFTYGEPE